MPDKSLTESAWKSFAKSAGGSYKDAPLLKALAAFEKSEKADAATQIAALDELAKQADTVRKAGKADKKLGDYLDGLDKALDKQRKTSEQALKDEKKAATTSSESEDDEESPALLTTKLVPLLRAVRKGDTTLQALIAIAGKETAVLLSRKSISPTRGKLLKDYLGVSGAIKFVRGECLFEANAHTFVVQSQAAGLAKKLKAALLAQTELRIKVRVRGEDPDDIDDDGEEAEADLDGDTSAAARTDAAPGTAVPKPPPPPEQVAFQGRLATMEPAIAKALSEQTGDVSRIRAVAAFAREKGESGSWAAGLQALNSLQKLLDDIAAAANPKATSEPTADPGPAFNARLAALLPRIKEAIAAQHPQAADVRLKVSEAGVFARKKEFDQANALLDDAESLLETGSVADRDETPSVDRKTAFKARLDAMQAAIKAAMAGPLAAELRPLVVAMTAAKTDYEAADRALDAIEALLGRGASGSNDADDQARPGQVAFEARLSALSDRYARVLSTAPADATRLRATMGVANEQAEAGRHLEALATLDRLEQLLDDADTAAPDEGLPQPGVVAYRSALLAFKTAAGTVQSQLQALKSAIPQALPDEAALADDLAAELQEFNEELQDAVDAAINAAKNDRRPVTQDLADSLAVYRERLDDNELIQHVDNNPFGVKVSVAQTLGEALRKIVQTMPEPA